MGRFDAAAVRRARAWTGAAAACGALALTAALAVLGWATALHAEGRFVPLGRAAIAGVLAVVLRAALDRWRPARSAAR